jgi:hypothetical protein
LSKGPNRLHREGKTYVLRHNWCGLIPPKGGRVTAYAFSRLKDSLGNEQQQKTNIFSADGTDAGLNQNASINGQDQRQPKTSIEGTLDGRTSGSQQAEGVKDTGSQQQGLRQTIQRNVGKTQNPNLLNRAQDSLNAADKAVQDEADSYVAAAKTKNYGVKDADIDSYVAGKQPGTEITDLLTRQAADKAEGFNSKQDLKFNDVDQLQSDEGIGQALRNEGGNSYTAGMGAFDLAALKRTPGFDQLRASLGQQRTALQAKESGYEKSKTAEAQGAFDANMKSAQEAARAGLDARATGITGASDAAAQAANDSRKAGRADFLKGQTKSALAEQIASLDPSKRLSPYISDTGTGINASDYYTDKDVTGADMLDQSGADQLNRIMTALGKGPESNRTAGAGAYDPVSGFNKKGFQDAIYEKATGQRAARDTDLDSQITNILGRKTAEKNSEQTAVDDSLKSEFSDVFGQVNVDPNAYFHNDYDTQANIDQLNPLYQELGQKNTSTSSGFGAFDADAYRNYLRDALSGRRTTVAVAEQKKVDDKKAADDAVVADLQRQVDEAAERDGNGKAEERRLAATALHAPQAGQIAISSNMTPFREDQKLQPEEVARIQEQNAALGPINQNMYPMIMQALMAGQLGLSVDY